jgi:penicillin amidase
VLVLAGGPLGYGYWVLDASRPALNGTLPLAGLGAQVEIQRDAEGVPTLTAANRLDLARATGFVHGQERFFQMDLLRRAGAGELSALIGGPGLKIDRERRIHRFRARAEAMMTGLSTEERALLDAYTAGVNAGLAKLGHLPWEYTLLRVAPAAWRAEDTALVTFAMYFDLQADDAAAQIASQAEQITLGPALANFLYPKGGPRDAAIDGSLLPEPPMPANTEKQGMLAPDPFNESIPGSNNFAVSGKLTDSGSAIVENDMHLALRQPHIWFRARLRIPGSLDITGVTLPGEPFVVVGSNTHIAWAFTDSFIETGDAVILETPPNDGLHYKTPDGLKPFEKHVEKICVAHAACEDLAIRETIWGPVVGKDANLNEIAWRWVAHDPSAVRLSGLLGLERAQNFRDALDAAHGAGMPQQNLVVGDSAGHIAWTVIGQIPKRVGLDDQLPHSWADGTHGWNGYLATSDIPEIIDPPNNRLWSANARMVGGASLALLGDGGYVSPVRARAIEDDLNARDHFAETDLLAIANDTRAHELDPWQSLLLATISNHAGSEKFLAMRHYVTDWGGNAVPSSVGYRLVREFRGEVINRIYGGLAEPVSARIGIKPPISNQANYVALRLMRDRPRGLVPPPFGDWEDVAHAALQAVRTDVETQAGGDLEKFTWGARNHTGIHHPLARAVPLLGMITDPPDIPVAGDNLVPRVAVPGFGASERMIVSPGHEEHALFNMPAGQSDNPLVPYYGAGEQTWVEGTPAPLLPGPVAWRMRLVPGE